MRAELKPYPAYKPSGADWIPDVPNDWDVRHLRMAARRITTGSTPPDALFDDDGTLDWYSPGDFHGAIILAETKKRLRNDAFSVGVRRFPAGSVLIVGIGATLGKVGLLPRTSSGNQQINCIVPRSETNGNFLTYFLSVWTEVMRLHANTATLGIMNQSQTGSIHVPMPSQGEQRDIVAFLDRETAKIDRLMEVRRKQVERLQEQRTAVIHHAVTNGLDPNARMKPSGIEWLGEVNCAWFKCDIKHVAEVIAGGTPKSSEYEYWDGDVVWLTPTDLGKDNARKIEVSARTITVVGQAAAGLALLPSGSLVMSTRAPVGSMGILAVPSTTNQGCKGMVFDRNKADGRFFFYLLSLAIPFLNAAAQGATFVELSGYQLKNLPIACPDAATQRKIADWLDQEMDRFDTLAAKYRRELELLAEYRASLISHAVTGKIDVRGLVPTVTEKSP